MISIENANSQKTKPADVDKKTTERNNGENKKYSSDIAALIDRPKKNPEKEEK